jgi:hypothetical protein
MMQMRKAPFLAFSPVITVAGPAVHAVHGDMPGVQAFHDGRNEVNPARQARETPI